MNFFLVPSQRYKDSRHFSQNPKVPRNVMAFSNRAQRFTGHKCMDVDGPFPNKNKPVEKTTLNTKDFITV